MPLPLIVTMIFAARWSSCSQSNSFDWTEAAPQHPTGGKPGAIGRMRQTVRSTVQHGSDWKSRHLNAPNFEMLAASFHWSAYCSACFLKWLKFLWSCRHSLGRLTKLCMSHPSSLATLSHRYFESLGRNIEEQADCQTRIEICWVLARAQKWDQNRNILWMEEILHQLVDGLSHDYPIIYSVL